MAAKEEERCLMRTHHWSPRARSRSVCVCVCACVRVCVRVHVCSSHQESKHVNTASYGPHVDTASCGVSQDSERSTRMGRTHSTRLLSAAVLSSAHYCATPLVATSSTALRPQLLLRTEMLSTNTLTD